MKTLAQHITESFTDIKAENQQNIVENTEEVIVKDKSSEKEDDE